MNQLEKYILMAFGALVAFAGVMLFSIKNKQGRNRIKLFGAEFDISAPSLVIFIVGCFLIIFPFLGVSGKQTAVVSVKQLKEIPEAELSERQGDLEKKFKAMEQQVQSVPKAVEPQPQYADISGVWRNPSGYTWAVYQMGNQVAIQETHVYYGITAVGRGIVNNQSVEIQYSSAAGTQGRAILMVSSDGKQMSGTANDFNRGTATPMIFYRG